jgi:hypothetical protein
MGGGDAKQKEPQTSLMRLTRSNPGCSGAWNPADFCSRRENTYKVLQFKFSLFWLFWINQRPVDFIEVHPENFLVRAALQAGRSGDSADPWSAILTKTRQHLISRLGGVSPLKRVWSQAPVSYTPLRKNLHEHL